tara:strand:+ start:143 stop:757 length:615 start_codon:yes stop_codon:yes gene_type:complete
MGVISNGTTMLDAGALDSGVATGAVTLIKTLTASSSANLSFVHGTSDVVLDGTYKEYIFKFIEIHPASDGTHLQIGFRDGGSNYDATIQTSFYRAGHAEADNETYLGYRNDSDLALSTSPQRLGIFVGNDNDQCCSGSLQLFEPSSTTFVKHFIARTSNTYYVDYNQDEFIAGYCNVTAAIDAVQFSMSSGNIDAGTIKLYGIK